MLPPMKALSVFRSSTLMAAALILGACNGEVSAPTAARTQEATSMFVPSASAKALIGVADGTYTFTFDPSLDQSLWLGPNHLSMPAHSVCHLGISNYGPKFWNKPCVPQTLPVTLTVIIRNASSANPSVDFEPAMRFSPDKTVQLFMYAPQVSRDDAKNWVMKYCPTYGNCFDESLTDASLATSIDYNNNVLFRRVKHFSGYTVAE
jgi:hypothetical protein